MCASYMADRTDVWSAYNSVASIVKWNLSFQFSQKNIVWKTCFTFCRFQIMQSILKILLNVVSIFYALVIPSELQFFLWRVSVEFLESNSVFTIIILWSFDIRVSHTIMLNSLNVVCIVHTIKSFVSVKWPIFNILATSA